MRGSTLWLALAVLAPALLSAQTTRDSVAVVAIEHAADRAIVDRDTLALDTLWAADLRFVHSDGTIDHKGDWIRRLQTGVPHFMLREADSLTVAIHGDSAVVTGRVHVRSSQPDEYWVRYVRVYSRRTGRWQLVDHVSQSLSRTKEPR